MHAIQVSDQIPSEYEEALIRAILIHKGISGSVKLTLKIKDEVKNITIEARPQLDPKVINNKE